MGEKNERCSAENVHNQCSRRRGYQSSLSLKQGKIQSEGKEQERTEKEGEKKKEKPRGKELKGRAKCKKNSQGDARLQEALYWKRKEQANC